MKRLLLPTLLMAASICGHAQDPVNAVLNSDFPAALEQQKTLPDGWTTRGIDATPAGECKTTFSEYSSTNAFKLLDKEIGVFAWSPSQFNGSTASDQWLYSPEFEVTADPMIITYSVAVSGSGAKNNFNIYISESGPEQENFYEIMGSGIKGKGDAPYCETRTFVLDGYKGEKVTLAFVNSGNTEGMLGFGEISVTPFYLALDNADKYSYIIVDEDHPGFNISGKVATPVAVREMKAVLKTSTGFESEYTFSGAMSATQSNFTLRFPEIDMMGQTVADYTVTITPAYKGAVAAEISGTINYGAHTYPGVLVLEELTGTWCGYCVYGLGSMEYLKDKYGKSAIEIAVHGGNPPAVDPMEVSDITSQTESLARSTGYSGYPHMLVNRSAGGHPAEIFNTCENIFNKGSYANVKITDIQYDEATRTVAVKYDAFASFDAQVANINEMAYITENNLTGEGKDWAQSNNLCNYTTEDMIKEVGETIAPYYAQYINGALSKMKMTYNDVARHIYPSFNGQHVEGAWVKDTAKKCEMTFALPDNVKDWRNVDVAVILTNSNTGEMIAGDRANLAGNTAVGMTEAADDIRILSSDRQLTVVSAEAGTVEVYTTDGCKLTEVEISEGVNAIDVDAKGLMILKVNAGNKSKSSKIILK